MIMPPGQNGRRTFEKILQIHPNQRAIIASGFAEDDDVQATLAMGAKAFISKPYTLDQIALTIHSTLQT
jgi:DNA-binding NarL/FixJ family response regulator